MCISLQLEIEKKINLLRFDMDSVLTGPQGDVLQIIQGLWGQVKVLTGLLDTAWQWNGLRGRLLWESTH